ncbi:MULTISPECIES: pyruvate carboxylase [Dehalobacter]|jgi:pyruvate carboxylase|uniref:pyruvate carboxylase n=1 Tax=Dehalobacter TaxID=56112 RepID=UPI0003190780|nr:MULTISPECIES: pyruvate carboxylase [Dehalobacter]MCG1025956.1 pyruvate carboxylase [Dehalobacter sp.]MDJ0304484.1 pyruvate carboxylase [Dehalobacter sp.]OCZ53159.1 pyruvate carboxylase [Dehalobacter sp. TeCB1]
MKIQNFNKVLVANRGEIAIRVFRACKELGIRTVAIYSEEDKYALFRAKADESYLIGEKKKPIEVYLSIGEIINLALKKGVDAIHPGYGFLSENPEFAEKCEEAGIVYIGPSVHTLENLGDKIKSKLLAQSVGVPVIPGVDKPMTSVDEAVVFAEKYGYPVILKAAAGGGGRGMRVVYSEKDLEREFNNARTEAKKAFGIEDIFIEKYLERPKHIEVQILADKYGNIVHLYERDCSVQRRHQKILEFTPAFSIPQEVRDRLYQDALKLSRAVNYVNAGTAEFLVDKHGNHYFIEMNPRIQVEHTITEMTTGIDIVQSQILVAQGYPLNSKEIGISSQESVVPRGYSIQCRITTEDPLSNFMPDTGKIDVYRTSSGFGIRLDGGNGYTGANISPYYDSLLVKIISWARTFEGTTQKAIRSVKEMNVKGVKTNEAFLINVMNHEKFLSGECDTHFIDDTPELFDIKPKKDYETKLLKYIGEKIVNEVKSTKKDYNIAPVPKIELPSERTGIRDILQQRGADSFVSWVKDQNKLLLTDTTFRDAHQSLLATRVRTKDLVSIAEATSVLASDLFSMEMWGGATFDVAYRFLRESPWRRLQKLRQLIPNIPFQMLIRGANAVGYTNYPDNLIRAFIQEAATQGIDIFRIFDSLNWLKGMEVAFDEVMKTGKIAEVCLCYTGDILDESKEKYSLNYYLKMAKEIEKMGAHILGIKDMSGLLKPYAATKLIKALKQEISIPIHLHTHDTSGNAVATILMAAEAGVDIVDAALSPMAGTTSQPSMDSIIAALRNTKMDPGMDLDDIQKLCNYWSEARTFYEQFESGLKSGTAEIYKYEIPGGQYSNLKPQVESFGLGHKFDEVKAMYIEVNQILGDIVKVTPTSKVVGDMAIFMIQNGLTRENLLGKGKNLAFPDSVVDYFKGMIGQPEGGFPEELQKIVLKGQDPITCRPGEILESIDFEKINKKLQEEYHIEPNIRNALSYALYPKVYSDYLKSLDEFGHLYNLESHVFFYGLKEGETSEIELDEGKTMILKLVEVRDVDEEGYKTLLFEINGNRREVRIFDRNFEEKEKVSVTLMADPNNPKEIASSITGIISKVFVKENEKIINKQSMLIIEAMKMETNIMAPTDGEIESILISEGQQVKSGQLIIKLK